MMDIDVACRNDLLLIAKVYAREAGLSLSTVSKRFHGKQQFLEEFAEGTCTITIAKLRDMVDNFSDLWPPIMWPRVRVLSRPRKRGVVYVVRRVGDASLVRIGYTGQRLETRLGTLNVEEKRNGRVIEVVGSLRGTVKNERSIHRHLEANARNRGERGWYRTVPEVTAFVEKLLSPDFAWGRCGALADADLRFSDDTVFGMSGHRRPKSRPQVSAQ